LALLSPGKTSVAGVKGVLPWVYARSYGEGIPTAPCDGVARGVMLMQKRPVISVIPGKSKGLPVRHTYQRRALATSVKLIWVERIGTRPAVRA
jgi:hypothetical protein